MGRKNKNTLGGAGAGAATGLQVGGGWGALAGAGIGALMGSQNDTEAQQIAPAVPQEVVDRLYRQANGAETTVGELKAAQLFDKTLAQQIAAARAARGTNPALLQRNVSRIAAEQSQNAAAEGAQVAAAERAKAMTQYLAAQQLNAAVNAKNAEAEAAADKQANGMLAGGLNAFAGSAALYAQRKDAEGEGNKNKIAGENEKMFQETKASYNDLGKSQAFKPVQSNTLGAANLPDYSMGAIPQYSDERLKTNIKQDLIVTSDERQKDLIKTEDLPVNNNMGMQNMQAAQPSAAPSAAPVPAAPAAPVTSAPAQQPAAAPKTSGFGLTPEMLAQAQRDSKRGGNVSDIKNATTTLTRAADGPSNDELMFMAQDAKNRESRDVFGRVQQSEAENYQANLGRWYAARDAKNAAFDKEAAEISQQNLAKDAQRTSRLNRFYTGIDTAGGAVASQYKTPTVYNTDLTVARHLLQTSDEDQKTDKKKDVKGGEFNPKSFLDKLEAYSYEYKNSAKGLPGVDDERHLGVMAQDLEKAGPVGESMVDEDDSGNKVVDYGKGFSAILASQAHLNKRLEQIEKMYSKKKKD